MVRTAIVLCCSLLGAACAGQSSSTERVCTAHFGRSCSSWEVRETAYGQMQRENQDGVNRYLAQQRGETFTPAKAAGESDAHYASRVSAGSQGPGGTSSFGSSALGAGR
jgi:hypothetical protein